MTDADNPSLLAPAALPPSALPPATPPPPPSSPPPPPPAPQPPAAQPPAPFDPSHAPAVRGRTRASSISFDLGPFKRLHRALEADHAHALDHPDADEGGAAYGGVAADEGGLDDDDDDDDGGNPWQRGFDREEVRRALGELLFHVEGLTTRLHAALTRQLETEHELKIARSNLMLTEANVEMLEESIRRGGQFGQAMVQQTQRKPAPLSIPAPSTPAGLSSPVQLNLPPLDRPHSSDGAARGRNHTAPTSAGGTAPPPSPGGTTQPSGGWLSKWGFSPSQNDSTRAASASSSGAGAADVHAVRSAALGSLGAAGAGSSTPNLPAGAGGALASAAHIRAHVPSQSTSAADPSHAAAVGALKTSLAEAHSLTTSLAKELAAVKDAKQALEGELEDLTGQLFQEANELVAEERQRAAAREEEAAEACREREAMRQTVSVVEADCRALREVVERLQGAADAAHQQGRRIPLKKGSSRSLRSNLSTVSRSAWAEEADGGAGASDDGSEHRLDDLMRNMAADMADPSTPTSATFPPSSPGLHSPEPLRTRSPAFSRSASTSSFVHPPPPSAMPKSPSASSFQSFSSDGSGASLGAGGGYRALPAEAGGKGRKVLLLPQTQTQP